MYILFHVRSTACSKIGSGNSQPVLSLIRTTIALEHGHCQRARGHPFCGNTSAGVSLLEKVCAPSAC